MDRIESVYAPILTKSRDDDGVMWVEGKITGPDIDSDMQRMDANWLKTAVPDWAKIGNVREQHNAQRPVGKAVQVWDDPDGSWYMRAKIVDKEAASKVEHGIYNGFSIGVKNATVVKTADAPMGLISNGRIVETSLADRPALPTCLLTIAKADEADNLQLLDTPVESVDDAAKADTTPPVEAHMTKDEITALLDGLKSELMAEIQKAAKPAEPVVETPPVVEEPDTTKSDQPDWAGLIEAAVTKAVEPLQTGLAKVTDTVNNLPAPGGPVVSRTYEQAQKSDRADEKRELLAKADNPAIAPALREGYRARAAAITD